MAKTTPDLPANIVLHQDSVFFEDQRFRNLLSVEAVESSWNKLIKSLSPPHRPPFALECPPALKPESSRFLAAPKSSG